MENAMRLKKFIHIVETIYWKRMWFSSIGNCQHQRFFHLRLCDIVLLENFAWIEGRNSVNFNRPNNELNVNKFEWHLSGHNDIILSDNS